MPAFSRAIGIDYSGAETPTASLKGLRVYLVESGALPVEVLSPPSQRKYWTRKGIAEWLVERLAEDTPTLVGIAREGRTGDHHNAFSIAAWLSRVVRDGSLAALLNPDLSPPERTLAQVEGWILGVPGLIRSGKGGDDSAKPNACGPSVFRLH